MNFIQFLFRKDKTFPPTPTPFCLCLVWAWACLIFLIVFKGPSFLQSLVFMLVEVDMMAASNSDANYKKVRQKQSFATQESVPGVEL